MGCHAGAVVAGAISNGEEGLWQWLCCGSPWLGTPCVPCQPEGSQFPFAFHLDQASVLNLIASNFHEQVPTLKADVDLKGFAIRFHPGCCVDGIPKQAVSRHGQSDNPSHHRT